MKRLILFSCLFFLVISVSVVSAAEKPLKTEELLEIRNYELMLNNLQLQIELLNREIERVNNERNIYFDRLYKNYELDRKWKIDLEKGIWVLEGAPEAEHMEGEKGVE